jgi:hypothetical protein
MCPNIRFPLLNVIYDFMIIIAGPVSRPQPRMAKNISEDIKLIIKDETRCLKFWEAAEMILRGWSWRVNHAPRACRPVIQARLDPALHHAASRHIAHDLRQAKGFIYMAAILEVAQN